MQLYGTPPSHFTRKVRVVLQELGLSYEFVKFENLMVVGEEKFASNPLHLFPVLVDGEQHLFDSDRICEYLIDKFGQGKELSSFLPSSEKKVRDGQRLAIINGCMSAGVSLMRAKRSGIEDWSAHAWLRQEKEAIGAAQRWLDRDFGSHDSYYSGRLTILDIALMCCLEWAVFREMILPWKDIPNLERFVKAHQHRDSFRATHPALTDASR